MSAAPIPLTLDLWALGHSASQIASMVGFPDSRHVNRIVHHARDIGDRRAAVHVGRNGRPLGRGAVAAQALDCEAVPAIPATRCIHGHLKTPDNVDRYSNCRECKRDRDRNWRSRR